MAPERYVYPPLPSSRHIRVLKLHPAPSSDDPALSVELLSVPLDNAPPFKALSYAWGTSSPRTEIRCSGLTIAVGPSLYSALCHMRHSTPGKTRLMWVDALCINQEDIPERNAQVRIMNDIYKRAWGTMIWLGEADVTIVRAFGWLRCLHEAFKHDFQRCRDGLETRRECSKRFSAKDSNLVRSLLQVSLGGLSAQLKAYSDIWAMLCRPWFSRKWVCREVASSVEAGLVFWAGSSQLPEVALKCFLFVLDRNHWARARFFEAHPSSRLEASTAGTEHPYLCYQRSMALSGPALENEGLVPLLGKTFMFQCSDVRDQIFALLSIATDSAAFDHLVDYNTPVKKLCDGFSRACLDNARDLSVMWSLRSIASSERPLSKSWVLDIEALTCQHRLTVDVLNLILDFYSVADKSGSMKIQTVSEGNRLWVKGRVVDCIEQLATKVSGLTEANAMHWNINSAADFEKAMGSLDRSIDDCWAVAKQAEKDDSAILSAILCENMIRVTSSVNDMDAAVNRFTTYRRCLKRFVAAQDQDAKLEALQSLRSVQWAKSALGVLYCLDYRRFGRSHDGALGWMPRSAQPDDLICIFDGMALPYAVRRAEGLGEGYVLLGECLISSLMAGETKEVYCVESKMIMLE
ncbi:hypothetical protein DHEL01_v205313 [Diaporthe helianthi]|uniref:Heterokaryon incompatibility domain-containing protein n=1 Tax=Diaporthe helianthi TaxID=158607 RepID=A0A2P5I1C9_DIAHE|nr:hypothetical protein DHEL01_v205313 [Diaporthe helianthi]